MAAPKKYPTEVALNLHTGGVMTLEASQVHRDAEAPEGFEELIKRCHIYLVCQRPKVSFVPGSVKTDGDVVYGDIEFIQNGQKCNGSFAFRTKVEEGASFKVSEYPHYILIKESPQQEDRIFPSEHLQSFGKIEPDSLRNYEVLYVGQAFGDGSRNAFDRLKSHSTLQKILAEKYQNEPNQQVQLFLFEYMDYFIHSAFDGRSKSEKSHDEDLKHWVDAHSNYIPKAKQISLAEASLIRYFQPRYNIIFRNNFPATKQKLLEECYELDFSMLSVEIDTEDLKSNLFSDQQGPGCHHIVTFDLHDPKIRRRFFALEDMFGNVNDMTVSSGPMFKYWNHMHGVWAK